MPDEPRYLTLTRTAYDTVAADYAEEVPARFGHVPFDPAMLACFAELVTAGPGGPAVR